MPCPPPGSPLFPYTTLFRSDELFELFCSLVVSPIADPDEIERSWFLRGDREEYARIGCLDRKSTRLNSSHANISYAVFCLKKRNTLPAPDHPSLHHAHGDLA